MSWAKGSWIEIPLWPADSKQKMTAIFDTWGGGGSLYRWNWHQISSSITKETSGWGRGQAERQWLIKPYYQEYWIGKWMKQGLLEQAMCREQENSHLDRPYVTQVLPSVSRDTWGIRNSLHYRWRAIDALHLFGDGEMACLHTAISNTSGYNSGLWHEMFVL